MKCSQCQHENPPESVFCLECGRRLAAACASCEAELPAGSKFCNKCGTPVATEARTQRRFASPETYTPKHLAEKILTSKAALEGERKQVTVLFADLKGSMELLADRDPEEGRKVLDPVLERMMEAVHRYEGTVNQVMGDGIMALFGAPLAHEDHAVRACYAALRMQENVKKYAEEVRRSHGVVVKIRVGLNSGEVVVRAIGSDLRMDYTAVGQTTHLAARMEQIADPGAIVITPNTLALVEGYVEAKSLGPVPVKGLPDAVEIHEVTGTGQARTRLQAGARRGFTRFVGRDAELAQLGLAQQLAADGHGQLVAVVGEPGVGKSRLFHEFMHARRIQNWLILESGSVSYGRATSYLPVIGLLKSYFKVSDRETHREVREKVTGKLLTLDRTLEPTLPALLALLDVPVEDDQWQALDPRQRRQRTLDAVSRLLLRESEAQPLILVFEDLHWADSETQALLDGLTDSLPAARLLLLINYRPEYQHAWGSKTYYTQLRLDALLPESADALLDTLLGTDGTIGPLKSVLVARTGGNPLFLEESVRTLVETQALVGERGSYRLAQALDTMQVPATVQAILASRIDRLPAEEKQLLQTAAVIGKDVPFALLLAIVDQNEETLRRGLTHLQAAEFVFETNLFPDLEYTFKHALTHDVTYGSLLSERRRVLHARVAEALKYDRPDEHLGELAHHYTCAGNLDMAVEYLFRVGQRAAKLSAHAEAIVRLTSALAMLEKLPECDDRDRREFELQVTLGPVLMAAKGWSASDVESTYSRALDICRRIGDKGQLFSTLRGVWESNEARGELQRAIEISGDLYSLAESAGDSGLLVVAHDVLADTWYWVGDLLRSLEHSSRGYALYEPTRHQSLAFSHGGYDPAVACLCHAACVLWMLGFPDQSRKKEHDALVLARQLSQPFSELFVLYFGAKLSYLRCEQRDARDTGNAAVTLCSEGGFPFYRGLCTAFRGWGIVGLGEPAGIDQIRQGVSDYARLGAALERPLCLLLLADACQRLRRIEEGMEAVSEALAASLKMGHRTYESELCRLRGELLLLGDPPAESKAEDSFREAIDIARRQKARSWELRSTTSLARLRAKQGRRDETRAMLAEIYGWFDEGFDTADLRTAKTLLDNLSAGST